MSHFLFEVDKWIKDHGGDPFANVNGPTRNREWRHMVNDDIISMPDKWEYPWYAAWDLAFHTLALSAVDIDFAKGQLELMLGQMYLHPNGQIPAYEWNFSDVNPPVHPWATLALYRAEQAANGSDDVDFLKRCFVKLLANFTWWLNRKDRFGKNVFEGGFLGLDNIGVFDRSAPLPTGGHLEQADGTAWMAFFSQNMLELAIEIAMHDPSYDEMAAKFMDHVIWISRAVSRVGPDGLWDEEDGFFYDVLRLPDGSATRLKVRSMVGLLPLCATTVIEPWERERVPKMVKVWEERSRRNPELLKEVFYGRGYAGRGLMALMGPDRLRRILAYMLDENEFLGRHGIRAVSRYHHEHPYIVNVQGQEFKVNYVPGDSDSGMFGGNSNWRGPIWMPMNFMLIRALFQLYLFYGDSFTVACPTGSGHQMNLFEVAREISKRLVEIFLRDAQDRRPVYGGGLEVRVKPREGKHDLDCTPDSTAQLAPLEDFSLVLGGPLYQLWRRLIGIPLVAWLPLLALTASEGLATGTAVSVPFLYDLEVHVRLLVAIPLFLLAEVIVHRRIGAVVPQFVDAGLVTPEVLPGFQAAIDRAMRLRNSLAVELILAVGVFGFGWLLWHETMSLGTSTWYSSVDPAGGRLTLAGQWYVHVSVPISQFFLYRWYFRLFVWALFLWRVSRLDLRLTPTHPDQAGGLGFLAGVPSAFALAILAQGALLSGSIGTRILLQGATLDAFRYEIAAFVILQLLVLLGPLAVFSPTLLALKRRGRHEYSALAARYTREFHAKWIGGATPPGEPLAGSGDIQSLADLANSYKVVQDMRAVPFGRGTIIQVAMAALVPLAPLVLTVVPVGEILKQLLVMLL